MLEHPHKLLETWDMIGILCISSPQPQYITVSSVRFVIFAGYDSKIRLTRILPIRLQQDIGDFEVLRCELWSSSHGDVVCGVRGGVVIVGLGCGM